MVISKKKKTILERRLPAHTRRGSYTPKACVTPAITRPLEPSPHGTVNIPTSWRLREACVSRVTTNGKTAGFRKRLLIII